METPPGEIDVVLFSTTVNLLISLAVAAFGAYWFLWLKTIDRIERHAFRYRAFTYWWLSWLAWVVAWGLLLIRDLNGHGGSIPFDISILILDNINTISLIVVYLVLTRGNSYNNRLAIRDSARILLSFALGYLAIYLLFSSEIAHELHKLWALCVSVFVPILVGWAFNLRFRRREVLIVGFIYGFAQPAVYLTQLPGDAAFIAQAGDAIKPIVAMVLALLKILWALSCIRILYSARSANPDISLIVRTKPSNFVFWKKWPPSVATFAVVLCSIYVILLTALAFMNHHYLERWAVAITVVTFFMSILGFCWQLFDKLNGR